MFLFDTVSVTKCSIFCFDYTCALCLVKLNFLECAPQSVVVGINELDDGGEQFVSENIFHPEPHLHLMPRHQHADEDHFPLFWGKSIPFQIIDHLLYDFILSTEANVVN
jgi:hypothetical protein